MKIFTKEDYKTVLSWIAADNIEFINYNSELVEFKNSILFSHYIHYADAVLMVLSINKETDVFDIFVFHNVNPQYEIV